MCARVRKRSRRVPYNKGSYGRLKSAVQGGGLVASTKKDGLVRQNFTLESARHPGRSSSRLPQPQPSPADSGPARGALAAQGARESTSRAGARTLSSLARPGLCRPPEAGALWAAAIPPDRTPACGSTRGRSRSSRCHRAGRLRYPAPGTACWSVGGRLFHLCQSQPTPTRSHTSHRIVARSLR